MDIRYVCSDEELKTNAVLSAVAEKATLEGILLAGTVQPVLPDTPQQHCHIVLGLLPDGEQRNVSRDLGPGETGCRLDAGALEEAVMVVHERLPGAQGLIVNKFGKQEAAGQGMVAAIGEACAKGMPVLVGVSPQWRESFLAFADGRAQEIAANETQIFNWLRTSSQHLAA